MHLQNCSLRASSKNLSPGGAISYVEVSQSMQDNLEAVISCAAVYL